MVWGCDCPDVERHLTTSPFTANKLTQQNLVWFVGWVMQVVNIHEAKIHLSRLVEQAARGESFVIAKAGKPLAKVTPLDAPTAGQVRRLGFLADEISVPKEFDRMGGDAIEPMFSGGA